MQEIREKYKDDNQKLVLEVRDIQVDIDRELIEDTVDWTKVEKLEKSKAEVKAQLAVSKLKMREEIEEKTGIDMPDFEGKGKRRGQKGGFGKRG